MMIRTQSFALLALAGLFALAASPDARPGAQRGPSRPQGPAPTFEWLSLCQNCPSPTLTTWSGLGTANARAEARMTFEAVTAEGGPCVGGDKACVQREVAKVYSASADCTAGRLRAADGQTYSLAGLWDDSDVGAGRTRWRTSGGQVVGRDNASSGLALAQQWEVLCPDPVSPALLARATSAPGAAQGPGAAPSPPASALSGVCAGQTSCAEVDDFAATITDFRASLAEPRKILTVTVRFQNKSNRALALGYVSRSGVATDERNNRYAAYDPDTRGIGSIGAGTVDDKFVLQPNQASDARFTFYWDAGRAVYGTTFGIELTVREIVPLPNGQQVRLGSEYPLRFDGLVSGARGAPSTSAEPAGRLPEPPSTAGATPDPAIDRCAASPRPCYDAGPFTVTANDLNSTIVGNRHHNVRLNVSIANNTDRTLVLAYKAATSGAIDDLGNAYVWGRPGTRDTSVQGIGMVEAGRSDTQFRLAPGASRSALFNVYRYNTPAPRGMTFTFDTVLVELRLLPNGTQTETVREYSVHLADLAGGGRRGSAGAAPSVDDIKKAGEAIRGIFGRRP